MQALSERDRLQARIVKEIALGFKKDVVLKGGGALRFVFGSPRQSEDLDYDVVAGLKVGEAFDYTTLVVTLGEHLRSIEVSARAKDISRPTRTPRP